MLNFLSIFYYFLHYLQRSNKTEMEENSISSRPKHNVKSRKFSIAVCVHVIGFFKSSYPDPKEFSAHNKERTAYDRCINYFNDKTTTYNNESTSNNDERTPCDHKSTTYSNESTASMTKAVQIMSNVLCNNEGTAYYQKSRACIRKGTAYDE